MGCSLFRADKQVGLKVVCEPEVVLTAQNLRGIDCIQPLGLTPFHPLSPSLTTLTHQDNSCFPGDKLPATFNGPYSCPYHLRHPSSLTAFSLTVTWMTLATIR